MANITEVYLMAVPLDKEYNHTFYFADQTAQLAYFATKTVKSFTDFSYQRKDNVLRIPAHIDELIAAGCNYVRYRNTAYSNKWFFAFIEDMEYINDGRTDVKIRTDCIQTWMFDITMKPSFVEREHAASDEIGEHTIDEGLETGEYTVNARFEFDYGDGYAVVVGVTKSPEGLIGAGGMVHGIYSGVMYYALENTVDGNTVNEFVNEYDEGAADAITCMFLAPKALAANDEGTVLYGEHIPNSGLPHRTIINKPVSTLVGYNAEVVHEFTTGTINGYTPRNKKLLCHPYRYLLASNNAGAAAVYHFEKFAMYDENGERMQLEPAFAVYGCLTPGCSVRMVPIYYNGATYNHEEGINMGKFPILNWQSDVYTNWLTQNSLNIAIDLFSGLGKIAGGAMATAGSGGLGAGLGGTAIASGALQIANTVGQIHQQSFTPPQARGNLNSGDVVTACDDNSFHFYTMSIKEEYARIIDSFFDMYGYKCNRVKIPEVAHRAFYWYTKTIDANIVGNIPQGDLQVIKDCYNRGITFWKTYGDNFRNYAVSNTIITGGEDDE